MPARAILQIILPTKELLNASQRGGCQMPNDVMGWCKMPEKRLACSEFAVATHKAVE